MSGNHSEKPILRQLHELPVDGKLEFPAARLNSVKSMASTFGFQWGRKFSVSVNREANTFTVTREN